MTKNLKGTDKILNLKEIDIIDIDSYSSSSCSGRVNFTIDCETEKGYCEDPDFTGKMEVLDIKTLANPPSLSSEMGVLNVLKNSSTLYTLAQSSWQVKKDDKKPNVYILKIKFVEDKEEEGFDGKESF